MAREFKLEDPGEGLNEAEIVEIQVSAGDAVEDGDIVFVVETDKALMDLPAPFTGTVEEIRVEEDDVVEVGEVLLTYTPADEEASGDSEAKEEEGGSGEEVDEDEAGEQTVEEDDEEEAGEETAEEESGKAAEEEEAEDTPVPASPATRRLARELDVDLQEVSGSGPEGRVTSQDVETFAEEREGEGEHEETGEADAPEEKEPQPQKGSGEESEDEAEKDLEARREEEPKDGAAALPFRTLVRKPSPLPDFSSWGPVHREPLKRIRRSVARRMTLASWEIPHVAHHDMVDITELERFRKEHEEAVSREGGQLSLTVLLLKATVVALKEHPRFNASLDVEAEEIVYKDYYNVGLAVDTEEGLVVPVIRDADGKSLTELSREIPELVDRVRDGEATQEDLQGGTFTITNPGPIGGTHFSPMIRHPEVAILGTAAARLEPVVQGDLDEYEIIPRLRLPTVLAFDHRVNDGADAARFMNTVVDTLGDLDALLLNM